MDRRILAGGICRSQSVTGLTVRQIRFDETSQPGFPA